MASDRRSRFSIAITAAVALAAVAGAYFFGLFGSSKSELGPPTTNAQAQAPGPANRGGVPLEANSVELSDSQLSSVKVEPVTEREFPIEKEAVGSISFNE